MASLTVSFYTHAPFTVVELAGELQHATSPGAEAQILDTMGAAGGPVRLVLNLTGVTFLDSGGVNLLAKTSRAVRAGNGTLSCVAPAGSRPDRVLTVTGFNQFMKVYQTVSEAVS
ncbi:STAS domain-containing protein [Actinocorallia longicatena]